MTKFISESEYLLLTYDCKSYFVFTHCSWLTTFNKFLDVANFDTNPIAIKDFLKKPTFYYFLGSIILFANDFFKFDEFETYEG